jgi:hypothetical protein
LLNLRTTLLDRREHLRKRHRLARRGHACGIRLSNYCRHESYVRHSGGALCAAPAHEWTDTERPGSLPDHAPHHLHLTPGTEAHDDYMRPMIPRLRALAADLAQHETHHAPTPSFFAGMRSIYVSWRASSISQSRNRRTAGFCKASDVVTA